MEFQYQFSILFNLSVIAADVFDLNLLIEVFILIILLSLSAAMSASEIAYFSLKPEDVRSLKSNGGKRAKTAVRLYRNPQILLSTILVANNVINIAFIFLAAVISSRYAQGNFSLFILVMATITFFLLLAGEITPKIFASRNRQLVVLSMAPLLGLVGKLLEPITSLLNFSPMFIRRRIDTGNFASDDSDADRKTSDDEKIFKGIANFGNTNVSAVMMPRIDVTAIDLKYSFDKVIDVIISSGFSRIPVYSGSFDAVKGILYAKDVLPFAGNPSNFKWQSLLRQSYFVPETKKINDLLKEFQLRKIHMAIVIDEYGGTSGIITLEDILEEIVGEITDETDEEETMFRRLEDSKFIFDGKIMLGDFCRVLGVDEEMFHEVKGESETLAGLMLELAGEIPQKDLVIKFKQFLFRIESVDKRRIREIFVEKIKQSEPEV